MGRKNYQAPASRPLQALQPALPQPWRQQQPQQLIPAPSPERCFLDLPAELRLEIYRLALAKVIVHIMPSETTASNSSNRNGTQPNPHPLLRTSRQIRLEVLPLMQTCCPIMATVTDFDFGGLLTWLSRIPPNELRSLTKNPHLAIKLCTTQRARGDLPTLRRWLKARADTCMPQPDWKYTGPMPQDKIASDLRRRVRRMPEKNKAAEFRKMLAAIGVHVPERVEGEQERDATPV